MGPADFADRLRGLELGQARRRGKFIWLPAGGSSPALVAHLGMSGQLLVQPSATPDQVRAFRIR